MPPKFDSTAVNIIFIRTIGGEIGAVSSLAPKLGPLGLVSKNLYRINLKIKPLTSIGS